MKSKPPDPHHVAIQAHYPLAQHHTLGFEVFARWYAQVRCETQWHSALKLLHAHKQYFILGNGTNTFFSQNYPGLVLHVANLGIEVIAQDTHTVDLSIAAGESWPQVVHYATKRGWWGIENLADIPGSAGAAVVQNIGAYGMELASVLVHVTAYALNNTAIETHTLSVADCQLGYRSSVFKRQQNWIIQSITLRLHTQGKPLMSYDGVQEQLNKQANTAITPAIMAQTISQLRQQKLPSLHEEGHAGSFFKNPLLSATELRALEKKCDKPIRTYPWDGGFKVSAAQLIEACGLKGHVYEHVGVSDQHALILVRRKPGPPSALRSLIHHVQSAVQQKFGICLEPEVCIL